MPIAYGWTREPAIVADSEPRPGAQFGQAQIEARDLELLGVIGDQIGFPSVAALIVEIVEIMQGDQSERVPVRGLLKLGRQQRVLAKRKNVWAVGAGVGVGLISEAELPIERELIDRDRLIDCGDIGLHLGVNVGGHIRSVEHGVEIIARHLIGAQMKIKHAELELHPGKIRIVIEHTFERADRRLVVAELGLELGVTEPGVEIVGLEQQALEQQVGGDELVRMAHGRGRRGGDRRRGRSGGCLSESGGGRAERRAGDPHCRRKHTAKSPPAARGPRGPVERRLTGATNGVAYATGSAQSEPILPLPLHQADPSLQLLFTKSRFLFTKSRFRPNATGFSTPSRVVVLRRDLVPSRQPGSRRRRVAESYDCRHCSPLRTARR